MTMADVSKITRTTRVAARRFRRWQIIAVCGITIVLGSTLIMATGFSYIPLPTWILSVGAFLGMVLTALAGMRLLALQVAPNMTALPANQEVRVQPRTRKREGSWVALSESFEALRSGKVPTLSPPASANEDEREAFELGNEAFQLMARRSEIIRNDIEELQEEIDAFQKYLSGSQVGLIGGEKVVEKIEEIDKRLAKIRSYL